ncbi:MAG: putative glucarate transporter [Planctomycetota bacterium]
MNHASNPSSSIGATQPTRVRWLIVVLLMLFVAQGHFNRVSVSVAGAERLIEHEGIGSERMGWVYTAFLIVYTLCMLPGGYLIDRLGARWSLGTMGLAMGACVIATGSLGWLGWTGTQLWIAMLVVRAIAGAFSVPLHPGSAQCVSKWTPDGSRSTANGLVTAAALMGIAVTYPIFGSLMDWLDWPLAFVMCGSVLLAFSLVWLSLSADRVGDHPWVNAAEKELVLGQLEQPSSISDSSESAVSRSEASRDAVPVRGVDGSEKVARSPLRSLMFVTASYAAIGYFQYLFFYWMQFYFDKGLHLPPATSRLASMVVTIAMGIGMACGGWVTDRLCLMWGPRQGRCAIAVLSITVSALVAVSGILAAPPWQVVVACFSIALLALGLCEGAFWTTAAELGGERRGLACAFMNTGGNAAGAVAPALTPWIAEHYGWNAAIVVACVICGMGGVFWFGVDSAPANRS